MFARILFPTDFSAYGDSVWACLPDLKTAGLREVVLLGVIRGGDVPMPETINRESLDYWQWSLGEKLNVAKMALEGKGLRASTRIEYGSPAEQIVRVAEDERVETIVMGAQGATFDDIAEILIAGNFGQSLVIEQTVRIGLLPDVPRERIRFIGNSSLAGARAALLSRQAWQRAQEIASTITCLELTAEPRYFEEYTAALFLPHTDLSLFPSLN